MDQDVKLDTQTESYIQVQSQLQSNVNVEITVSNKKQRLCKTGSPQT